MTSKSQNIINELDRIAALFNRLTIVETGTIRRTEPEYEEGDGHSTRFIAEWSRGNHSFTSIDIDCSIAKKYLFDNNLRQYVTLKEGLSTDILPTFKMIDFAYLDSANDPDNCLNEFMIVWPMITPGGSVMCDDCNEGSAELLKGDKLIPYLRSENIEFEQMGTNQLLIKKPA